MNPWVDAVARLWPDARVATGRDPEAVREFAFLPSAGRPRLLLPAGLPAAAAAALRRYSHDLGARQRATRALTATAVRAGLADRALRDRVHVTGDGESIEDRLGELLGRRVVISLGLGTARANRKPVLHALTPAGEPLAFVKIGDTPTARQLIAAEAAALGVLARRSLRGMRVPDVLHHGEWRGLGLLVLSPLPTTALSFRSRRTPPIAAMRELAGETRQAVVADTAFWARLSGVPLRDPAWRDRFGQVVARIGAMHGGDTLEFGAWHGDWTPWNMAWRGGRVQLWDWERFDPDVPMGLDLVHYRLQTTGAYDAWPEPELARPLVPDERSGAAVAALYLLELARRYLTDAEGTLGEPLRERAAALLDLLDTGTRRMR